MKIFRDSDFSSNGFTLIEIIIVLSLMVLVTGLSMVFYTRALPQYRLDATTREMISELRRARTLARIQNEKQIIVFHLDQRVYGLKSGKLREIPEGIAIKMVHPYQGEIRKGSTTMAFLPTGQAESLLITLSNEKRSRVITIDPVVGAALVQ